MANIAVPYTFSPGLARSAEVNANFTEIQSKFNTYAVQTDVAKTITAAHTFAANVLFTDNLYDIGGAGANRPRDGHFVRDLIAAVLRRDTADGSDTSFLELAGGGTPSSDARAGRIVLFGNEHANTGSVRLIAGDVVSGQVVVYTRGIQRWTFGDTGILVAGTDNSAANKWIEMWRGNTPSHANEKAHVYCQTVGPLAGVEAAVLAGRSAFFKNVVGQYAGLTPNGIFVVSTTVETDANVGDIVLPNAKELRGVNAAGNGSRSLVGIDANNIVGLGGGYAGDAHVAIIGVAAGSLPAAGATHNGVLTFDTTNNRLIFYVGGNRYWLAGTSF